MNVETYHTKITILIVLFKENTEIIFKTLNKLKSFKKVIVDNAGNFEIKKKIQENFLIEKYIVNKKNIGFSAGYNQALSLSSTKYSLILNPDCIIDEKDIIRLVDAYIKCENCFLVVPTSYDENNNFTYSGGLLPENGDKNNILELSGDTCIESALGACMLINTNNAIDFGLFDENFFLYFSDDDLCRRIKKNKQSIIQVFKAKCFHKHGNIKVKNKFYKTFIREYNYTFDELYYFYKINRHNELINIYKKKIPLYFVRVLSKIFTFKFLDGIKIFSRILAYLRFIFKFKKKKKNNQI